jgi:hypothetical protein
MDPASMSRMLLDQGLVGYIRDLLTYYFGSGPIAGLIVTMLSVSILGYARKMNLSACTKFIYNILGKFGNKSPDVFTSVLTYGNSYDATGKVRETNLNADIRGNRELYKSVIQYINFHNVNTRNSTIVLSTECNPGHNANQVIKLRDIHLIPKDKITLDTFPDMIITQGEIVNKDDVGSTSGHTITITTRISSDHIREFLTTCLYAYADKVYPLSVTARTRRMISPFRESGQMKHDIYTIKNSTTFDTIFSPNVEKIRNHLSQLQNGAVEKMILLLTGPPGTGKSSIIKAIASEADRDIIEVNLNDIHSMRELRNLIYKNIYRSASDDGYLIPNNQKCFVFEDITDNTDIIKKPEYQNTPVVSNKPFDLDVGVNKKTTEFGNTLTFQNVLQVFDGILGLKDMIFILTTNNPEQLHETFTRKGRITLEVKMDRIEREYLDKYAGYYFNTNGSKKEKPGSGSNKPIEINGYLDHALSPSSIENIFIHSANLKMFKKQVQSACIDD